MRRLALDFHRPPRPGLLAWALLAAGVLGVGVLLWSQGQLQQEASALRMARSAGVPPAETRGNAAARTVAAPELQAARQALTQIGLPWNDVFTALESAAHRDVALLAVTPDPRKGQLRITAEARNLPAMLDYHQRLGKAPHLRDAALTDHEVVEDDPQHPVRFNITATWVIQP